MENTTLENQNLQPIHWGHFAIISGVMLLLLGVSYMEKPELFDFKKTSSYAADPNVPHYYAYVAPDSGRPEVLGASTAPGPQIIGDDGTIQSVDMGQVLAASTQGVELSLDSVKVNTVPDSETAVKKYFNDAQAIESSGIGDTNFAAALTSGNQEQINQQAQKIINLRDSLQKLSVPQSLVRLQKLQIIQYDSAIAMLQNFTNTNQDPQTVNENLQQFLKSQQDLDQENLAVAQKYPTLDPNASSYVDANGKPLTTQSAIAPAGSSQ